MRKLFIIAITMLVATATTFAAERAKLKMFGKDYELLQRATSHTAYYSKGKGLTMTFSEAEMTAAEKKSFSAGVFTLEKDIVLDAETAKALNAPKGIKLKKGNYKILKNGKGYEITFSESLDSVGANPMT